MNGIARFFARIAGVSVLAYNLVLTVSTFAHVAIAVLVYVCFESVVVVFELCQKSSNDDLQAQIERKILREVYPAHARQKLIDNLTFEQLTRELEGETQIREAALLAVERICSGKFDVVRRITNSTKDG